MDDAVWTEDACTCEHAISVHEDGDGRCESCDNDRYWQRSSGTRVTSPTCVRFQWDGRPRKRTW